jgi:hypothetical protein
VAPASLRCATIVSAQFIFNLPPSSIGFLPGIARANTTDTLGSEGAVGFVFEASAQVFIELILNGIGVDQSSCSKIDDVAEVDGGAARI